MQNLTTTHIDLRFRSLEKQSRKRKMCSEYFTEDGKEKYGQTEEDERWKIKK
jgi:hypothetical protein